MAEPKHHTCLMCSTGSSILNAFLSSQFIVNGGFKFSYFYTVRNVQMSMLQIKQVSVMWKYLLEKEVLPCVLLAIDLS